eukprot:4131941-Pyramimonas_sp.AAC.2
MTRASLRHYTYVCVCVCNLGGECGAPGRLPTPRRAGGAVCAGARGDVRAVVGAPAGRLAAGPAAPPLRRAGAHQSIKAGLKHQGGVKASRRGYQGRDKTSRQG